MGCHSLLQGIFPAQKLNLSLPHWQVDSLPWCHLGSPFFMMVCFKLPMGSFGGTGRGQGTAEGIQGQIVRAVGWLLERIQRQSELPLSEPKASVRSTDFRSPAHRSTCHSQASVYLLLTLFVCFQPHAIQLAGTLVPWSSAGILDSCRHQNHCRVRLSIARNSPQDCSCCWWGEGLLSRGRELHLRGKAESRQNVAGWTGPRTTLRPFLSVD